MDEHEIVHWHIGKMIVFKACDIGIPINNREFHVMRDTVLRLEGNFYEVYKDQINFLVEKGE